MTATDRPNVVVIMTDQHRGGTTAREGFELDTMPVLDDLVSRGAWFDRAYTTYPMCVPARTSFLTGRYPSWTGVQTNDTETPVRYERDLFDVMNEAGYATALCGKNHTYLDEDRVDHWYQLGHLGGNPRTEAGEEWDDWIESEVGMGYRLEPAPGPAESHPVGRTVSESVEWIESLDDRPFFLWLSIPEPHPPYQIPEPYYSLFGADDVPDVDAGKEALNEKGYKYQLIRRFAEEFAADDEEYDEVLPRVRALYYGMMRMIDDQLDRFVEFLDRSGLRDETLLVFTADHADYAGEYGMMRKTAGVPESQVRVPMAFVGPSVDDRDGPHPAHVSLADVMPTLCEVADVPLPRGVQGRSLWPLVRGEEYPEAEFRSVYSEVGVGGRHSGREIVDRNREEFDDWESQRLRNYLQHHALSGTIRTVRMDDWKLTFDMRANGGLYDLEEDPAEVENLFDDPEYAERRAALVEELLTWQLRLDALDIPHEIELTLHPRNYWHAEI